MKPGIRIGQIFTVEIVVTEAMQASFEGSTVHPLYSTASMVTHMEWASRQHILPFLEPEEEGAGYHLSLEHLSPLPVGETVKIISRVTGLIPKRVICHCEAYHGTRKIGQAKVVQAILPLHELHAKIP